MKRKLTAALACFLCLLTLAACTDPTQFSDKEKLSGKVKRNKDAAVTYNYADGAEEPPAAYNDYAIGVTDFALKELAAAAKAESGSFTLSSASAILQLSMLTNACSAETRQDITLALGNIAPEDLNTCSSYFKSRLETVSREKLGKNEKAEASIKLNGAMLLNNNTDVKTAFLQNEKDFYGYDVFRFDFNGKNAQKKLHNYSKSFPYEGDFPLEDGTMHLLASSDIRDTWLQSATAASGSFSGSGGAQDMDFFTANAQLMHTDKAKGAVLYTAQNPLKLVLVMPNEGVSLDAYLSGFNSDEYNALLNSADFTKNTAASVPCLSLASDKQTHGLSPVLSACGLETLFSDKASFSALSYHAETKLGEMVEIRSAFSLDQNGVNAKGLTAPAAEQTVKPTETLRFDRPFLFMLIDNETNIPVQTGVFKG